MEKLQPTRVYMRSHTSELMSFKMINTRETSLADCAAKVLIGRRLHDGPSGRSLIGEERVRGKMNNNKICIQWSSKLVVCRTLQCCQAGHISGYTQNHDCQKTLKRNDASNGTGGNVDGRI